MDASREPLQALCARRRRTSEGLDTWDKFVRRTDLWVALRVQFRAPRALRVGEERVRSAVPVATTAPHSTRGASALPDSRKILPSAEDARGTGGGTPAATEGAREPRRSEVGQGLRAKYREWASGSLRTTPVTLDYAVRAAEGARAPTAGRDLPDDGV